MLCDRVPRSRVEGGFRYTQSVQTVFHPLSVCNTKSVEPSARSCVTWHVALSSAARHVTDAVCPAADTVSLR